MLCMPGAFYTMRFMRSGARNPRQESEIRQVVYFRPTRMNFGLAILMVEISRRGIDIDRRSLDLIYGFNISRPQIYNA